MSALPRERPPGEPQSSPVTGTVTHWHVTAGEQVVRYDSLAVIDDDGLETLLTASTAGTVSATAPLGTLVAAGQPVAYIVPHSAPQQPSKLRRSNSLHLTLLDQDTAPQPAPRPRQRASKQKIVKHTSHITNEQQDALRQRVEQLGTLGGDYAQAELERLAFSLLLGLEDAELIRQLEAQRDVEEQGRYGFGNRPR